MKNRKMGLRERPQCIELAGIMGGRVIAAKSEKLISGPAAKNKEFQNQLLSP